MKNLKSFLAKHFLILAFAVGSIFAVTSNVTVSGNNPPETGINQATCYSTYTKVPFVAEFWRCGDCTRVNGINKSDPGICYFK